MSEPCDTKRCPSCGSIKSLQEFNRNRHEKSGHQSHCRECARAYYQRNKIKILERDRRKYASQSEFYWRVRLRTVGSVLLAKPFFHKYTSDPKCFFCRIPLLPDQVHIDHLTPASRGGETTIDNLVVSCADCNHLKHDRTLVEFTSFLYNYLDRFLGNEAEAGREVPAGHRERLSEPAPVMGDATVCSHGNTNHERSAEMTDPPILH